MASDDQPLTSFVIPCFNHGAWIAQAVGSCLAQRSARVEVIVVDDGSNDGKTPAACDALEGPSVRVMHQANTGLPAARNAGAAQARGGRLAFLDADDWVEPQFVSRLAEALGADRSASHAYCQERLTDLGGNVVWRVPEWDPITLLVTNLHPVTCLVRRDRFEHVGGFDESMTQGYEDWDLWLRFASHGWHGVRVREVLFNWRRHSPHTMIDEAVQRHDQLYRRLLRNHRDFFEKHAADAAVRANTMLRAAEGHWVDETGVPIELQYLRAVRDAHQRSQNSRAAPLGRLARWLPSPVRRWLTRGATSNDAVTHPAAEDSIK